VRVQGKPKRHLVERLKRIRRKKKNTARTHFLIYKSDPKCQNATLTQSGKDGLRYPHINAKPIQRYICRECGYRFSKTTQNQRLSRFERSELNQKIHRLILKTPQTILYNRQVGVRRQSGAKNLVPIKTLGRTMTTHEEANLSTLQRPYKPTPL
jgi:uncharacterized protein YlaI